MAEVNKTAEKEYSSVSYTHLDVYKRQPMTCLEINRGVVGAISSPILLGFSNEGFSVLEENLSWGGVL